MSVLTSGFLCPKNPLRIEESMNFSRSHLHPHIIFQDGNLQVWLAPTKRLADILLPAASPLNYLWDYIQDGTIGLGCALHIPPGDIPDQSFRPDGSCGLQLAGFALLTGTDRPFRPSDEFFNNSSKSFRTDEHFQTRSVNLGQGQRDTCVV